VTLANLAQTGKHLAPHAIQEPSQQILNPLLAISALRAFLACPVQTAAHLANPDRSLKIKVRISACPARKEHTQLMHKPPLVWNVRWAGLNP
jgi:hypothetical protein